METENDLSFLRGRSQYPPVGIGPLLWTHRRRAGPLPRIRGSTHSTNILTGTAHSRCAGSSRRPPIPRLPSLTEDWLRGLGVGVLTLTSVLRSVW